MSRAEFSRAAPPRPEDFRFRASEKIRYADQDPQGHVNNVVFATYLEIGRTSILPAVLEIEEGAAFVVARLAIDYLTELAFPGEVLICTRLVSAGRTSLNIEQALFQSGHCAATALSVVVLVERASRRPRSLSQAGREWISARS